MEIKRPPFGLTPKYIWCEQRVQDIQEAIKRYAEANKSIPIEWITEYNKLITDIKKDSSKHLTEENEIKIGSMVRYHTCYQAEEKQGEVAAIVTIADHKNKDYIGKQMAFINYRSECEPDIIPMEYLKAIN